MLHGVTAHFLRHPLWWHHLEAGWWFMVNTPAVLVASGFWPGHNTVQCETVAAASALQ